MKIKTKTAMLSFIGVMSIVFPITIVIYMLFAITEENEAINDLRMTASTIIHQLSPDTLMQAGNQRSLRKFLPDHALIRTLNTDSEVINQSYSTTELFTIPPKFVEQEDILTKVPNFTDEPLIIVRLPITQDEQFVGTLEIVAEPLELKQRLFRLIEILIAVTLLAFILSISISLLMSKMLLSPISRMVRTMEDIELSLEIRKIPMDRKSKDELYQLTTTFNRLMERIETSMNQQRQFISDASHEFKTSLTIMEGYASLVRRWGLHDMELYQEALETIYSESIRMKSVTYQMLDLAKIEQGASLEKSCFNIVQLCTEIIQTLQPLTTKHIRLQSNEETILMEADSTKIKQVLFILLDNALKYSKHTIDIEISNLHNQILLKIVDDGIGIPKDELPLVFNRFYRTDRSRSRHSGGAGLGLSIAQAIVKQHHGSIHISSELQIGTEITILLPVY
ncbi:sensor histidine kinase [Paenibacillus aestuarii]|uniref:histidine kinase n=1 Tax=Paenibacillus aestuarii TaxID=516965 RepID=A0ABW0KIN2_9BACL|nr:ATP-binding protein [Paenibacillus aestuarii]